MGGFGDYGARKYDSTASRLPRRSCGDEMREQGGDELLQEPRRVAVKEAEIPPPAPSAPAACPSALTNPSVVVAAAGASRKKQTTEPPFRTAELRRRKSSCPGLYCTRDGQGREEQEQPAGSTRTLLVSDSRRNRDRCVKAEAAAGEEVARNRKAPSESKQEMTTAVGDGGSPGAGEAYPMFQLPLKVRWEYYICVSVGRRGHERAHTFTRRLESLVDSVSSCSFPLLTSLC